MTPSGTEPATFRLVAQGLNPLRHHVPGDRKVATRISAPVRNGTGAHPPSCTMGTGSPSRKQSGQGAALNTHPHLASRVKKDCSYTSTPLLAFMACSMVNIFAAHKFLLLTTINSNDNKCTMNYIIQLCGGPHSGVESRSVRRPYKNKGGAACLTPGLMTLRGEGGVNAWGSTVNRTGSGS